MEKRDTEFRRGMRSSTEISNDMLSSSVDLCVTSLYLCVPFPLQQRKSPDRSGLFVHCSH